MWPGCWWASAAQVECLELVYWGLGKKKEGNKCCVVQCCSTKVYRGIKGSLLKKESSEDKRGTNSAETTCFLVQQGSIKPIEQVNPLRLINVIGSHFLVRESRSELRPFLACEWQTLLEEAAFIPTHGAITLPVECSKQEGFFLA